MQVFIDSPDSLLASFESRNESGPLILVSGPSGSGKMRWCPVLVNSASILGILVSGLVSPAVLVKDPNYKIYIDLPDLGSAALRQLAGEFRLHTN